jgi:hypothetical protein
MKSYRIEGQRLPMFTFNEVANINIGGQSAARVGRNPTTGEQSCRLPRR